jgi:hypothetical protein
MLRTSKACSKGKVSYSWLHCKHISRNLGGWEMKFRCPFNRETTISKIIVAVPRLMQLEQSQSLMRLAAFKDVEEIVKIMASENSPGPDGFIVDFYQAVWEVLGQFIWEVVEESRTSKFILQPFNSTFITLILKVKGANTIDMFLPISLCNFIYKIISKLVATILKPILPLIISQEQGVLVEGRKILN